MSVAVVKNLMTRAGFDASGMRKGVRQAQNELNNFKRGVSSAMKGIAAAFAATGVGLGMRAATKDAMDFESSLQQINRMMGQNANTFNRWVKEQASSFGMARSEATKYGAVFANLISGFSTGTVQTAQYTQDLLKAASVIASSTGRTIEDTMDRIRSGMLGSTEAIEDLGINVNIAMIEATDAFKRFANGKSWQQLDLQTQQTVRYFAILEQSAKKYGVEINKNASSDQAKFIAQLKNSQLALGQAFLPIYTTILPALTRFATSLANVLNNVAQFSQALFGSKKTQEQAKAVGGQASAVEGLGEAYEEAGKAAKDSVAGFDQLNEIGGTTGTGTAAETLSMDDTVESDNGMLSGVGDSMEELSARAREMAEKVKATFARLKNAIVQNKDMIIASLAGIASGFATYLLISNWSAGLATLTSTFQKLGAAIRAAWLALTGPIGLIVLAVAALTAAFVYFYRTNESFRGVVDGILQQIANAAIWLWQSVLVPFGQWLGTVMVATWNVVSVAAQWLWKNVLVPLGNFLLWMHHNVIVPIAKVLVDALAVSFEFVSEVAKLLWKKVLVPLGNAMREALGPAVDALSAVLTFLWSKVMKPLGTYIGNELKPIFKGLADTIVWLYENAMKPLANYLGGVFLKILNNAFDSIGGVIEGVKTAFIGLMSFITGVFTGDWQRAWDGVRDIFRGVFDSLWSIVKFPLNLIIDGINALISGLNKIKVDVPSWVGKIPGVPDNISSFGFNIPKIPKLATGTNYVPRDMLAMLHKGEAVVPEKYNPESSGTDNREVVSVLKAILQVVKESGNSDTATLSKTELARAAASGINDLSRRSGKSLLAT